MKQSIQAIGLAVCFAWTASGQGTFVYDQQSSDESNGGSFGADLTTGQPLGQSFAPVLSAVGFISLHLHDRNPGNGSAGPSS